MRVCQCSVVVAVALLACLVNGNAFAQGSGCTNERVTVFEWQQIKVPKPSNWCDFVRNEDAAIRLGKALFWDMQVGSDGIIACGSCHFHAGADNRVRNQLSPTGSPASDQPGASFEVRGPNGSLTRSNFPFHNLVNRENRDSELLSDSDDVVSSQGVAHTRFIDVRPGEAEDRVAVVADPVFNVDGINTRRVEPRNAPTIVNAVFTVEQFWDGRGKFWFNGVNEHGLLDENARILVRQSGGRGAAVRQVKAEIDMASLASQALAPPVNGFEMSADGRIWPKIGKKMLSLRPLAKQIVHPEDSMLGALSRADGSPSRAGLSTNYKKMIKQAFNGKYWKSNRLFDAKQNEVAQGRRPANTDEYTLMEMNFSLFFGLAVQAYESTLVSDDSPLDRFMAGDRSAMTAEEQLGMDLFVNDLPCINCHKFPEVTKATIEHMIEFPTGIDSIIERMNLAAGGANGSGDDSLYDGGFYNVGARPFQEDLGRAETVVIGEGADAVVRPKSFAEFAATQGQEVLRIPIPRLRKPVGSDESIGVIGAMRVPSLRNSELTGPYYHNGGLATLYDVVQFYTRGSDFREENIDFLDPGIGVITPTILEGHPDRQRALAAFMSRPLTDDRVRYARAPFDHPQIFVPNGHPGNANEVTDDGTGRATDDLMEVPAVGANGRAEPLLPFLEFDPLRPSP